jgi:rubrerythrin
MRTSHDWRLYFEENARALLDIPWQLGPELTPDEKAAIGRSLQEFQAGESSEGKHLLKYAQQYAERTGDHEYVPAIRLFIAEEQRHARDLGRFLKLNGIPLVRTTFTDRVFRRLRHLFGGLEISIAVLITAEIIAEVYYAVLREATQSLILRRLCDQILRDERQHVRFQAEQLARLRRVRRPLALRLTMAVQRFLYVGTTIVVWFFHRNAIRRGGLGARGWWRYCWQKFNEASAVAAECPESRNSAALEALAAIRVSEPHKVESRQVRS